MHVERRYPVTPRVLLDMLTDPAFLAARNNRYGGAGPPRVSHDNGRYVITVPRQLPMEHVPSAFQLFVGDGRFVEVDTWHRIDDGGGDGAWTVDAGKAPITLSGRHDVRPTADGCVHVVAGRVKVSLPIVGARIAREVDEHLAELVRHEMAFTAEWLERGPAS